MKDRCRAFVIYAHGWQGFRCSGGEIAVERTLGFITVGYMPRDIWKRLNKLKAHLDNLRGKSDDE